MASKSSDTMSDGHISRHHLLCYKLTLDEVTPADAVQSEEGKRKKSKRRGRSRHLSCKHISNLTQLICLNGEFLLSSEVCFDFFQADGENESIESALDDDGMSEELSQSEEETSEEKPQRFSITVKNKLFYRCNLQFVFLLSNL